MSEYTQSGKEEKLTEFIEKYKRGKYRKEIARLSQINGKSILIDLSELAEYEDGQIGSDISNNSDEVLEQFETAAFKILIEEIISPTAVAPPGILNPYIEKSKVSINENFVNR